MSAADGAARPSSRTSLSGEESPVAALFGRPNVGKSTLFNRLIRSRRAVAHDRPGVTRDRMEGTVKRRGEKTFLLVDTGGITLNGGRRMREGPEGLRGFEAAVLAQAEAAARDADLLCLVADARDGLTPLDEELASFLRRTGKEMLLVLNKVDGPENEDAFAAEFHSLGLPLICCSAAHGHHVRALEDELRDRLFPPREDPEDAPRSAGMPDAASTENDAARDERLQPDKDAAPLRLAMLGRPNAGKSSLVNALLGEARMIVSDREGTTRDSVDVRARINDADVVFVDTAGVRKPARVTDAVERFSVDSSLKSSGKARVTLLVLDAARGVTRQDKRLAELLNGRKSPFVLLVNKADLIGNGSLRDTEKAFRETLEFISHVPMLFVSAETGLNLDKIVPLALELSRECSLRIGTGLLNRAMVQVLERHQPPRAGGGGRAKFFYLTQAETDPPTFVFFVNDAERVLPSYARYLEKSLRGLFGIKYAPLRVNFRSSHGKKSAR